MKFPEEYKKNYGIIFHVMESRKYIGAVRFSSNLEFLSKEKYFTNIRNSIEEFENNHDKAIPMFI